MTSIELEIRNASGLHARPAVQFVRAAQAFESTLLVRNIGRDGPEANAKSILGVLGIGVSHGGRIELIAHGPDEAQAVEALRALVEGGLGEPAGASQPGG